MKVPDSAKAMQVGQPFSTHIIVLLTVLNCMYKANQKFKDVYTLLRLENNIVNLLWTLLRESLINMLRNVYLFSFLIILGHY